MIMIKECKNCWQSLLINAGVISNPYVFQYFQEGSFDESDNSDDSTRLNDVWNVSDMTWRQKTHIPIQNTKHALKNLL